ncbi:MAG: hypothetical protein JJU11_05675 [Candidatus Sumerlaeia bacterium]|nr:hypothetical protein [Candidatus Sumerlaeia bacterium]
MIRLTIPVILAGVILTTGCGRDEVEVYELPKGSETIAEAAGQQETTAPPPRERISQSAATPEFRDSAATWDTPENWQEMPDPPPMRLKTYVTDGPSGEVEIAITRFPGDVGGILANINRWRGQVGLGPISEGELGNHIESFTLPGFEGYFTHLRGPQQHMLAAGIWEEAIDQTWFVRVTTDPTNAEAVKDEVLEFARSFRTDGVVETTEPQYTTY